MGLELGRLFGIMILLLGQTPRLLDLQLTGRSLVNDVFVSLLPDRPHLSSLTRLDLGDQQDSYAVSRTPFGERIVHLLEVLPQLQCLKLAGLRGLAPHTLQVSAGTD